MSQADKTNSYAPYKLCVVGCRCKCTLNKECSTPFSCWTDALSQFWLDIRCCIPLFDGFFVLIGCRGFMSTKCEVWHPFFWLAGHRDQCWLGVGCGTTSYVLLDADANAHWTKSVAALFLAKQMQWVNSDWISGVASPFFDGWAQGTMQLGGMNIPYLATMIVLVDKTKDDTKVLGNMPTIRKCVNNT